MLKRFAAVRNRRPQPPIIRALSVSSNYLVQFPSLNDRYKNESGYGFPDRVKFWMFWFKDERKTLWNVMDDVDKKRKSMEVLEQDQFIKEAKKYP